MEKICKNCGAKETTKWFSGPICRKCYRSQPHIKAAEKKCRDSNIEHYREYWKQRNSTPEFQKYNKIRNARYYESTKEKQLEKTRVYRRNNKDKVNNHSRYYQNKRKLEDINFKLRCILRSRLSHALKNNQKVGSAVKDLGCSMEFLKSHLENKFLPGMSWENYGHSGWHIDHIKPLVSFDLSDPIQFKEACHYSNLQPLWAEDNLKKGAK